MKTEAFLRGCKKIKNFMENIDSGGLFRYNIDKSKTLYGKPAERQGRKAKWV